MNLSLPADAEPHIPAEGDLSDLRGPGVYCLNLSRPNDLAAAWDATFDVRPDYWESLVDAHRVVYVGASADVLGRLEDHRDGDVRKSALLRVCEIEALRNIWWFKDADAAFEKESQLALMLQNDRPAWYVHQR